MYVLTKYIVTIIILLLSHLCIWRVVSLHGDRPCNSLKMAKMPEACVGDSYIKNKNILQLVVTEIYG